MISINPAPDKRPNWRNLALKSLLNGDQFHSVQAIKAVSTKQSLTKVTIFIKLCFVDCVTCDSQFRNGYLARDQNLPRSNFFAGLKIAMEGKYDVHCTRLGKM